VKLTRALVRNLDEAIKEVKLLREDADNGGDAAAPPTAAPPPPAPPATVSEEINEEGPIEVIPEQEVLMPHEIIMLEAEPEVP
jgi:hypothetical protein